MGSPVILHLTRPYGNAEEYLSREAWTIDTRSMLLVGQPELPAETDIAFDVTLADGSKPIRAEARVIGPVAASADRPGGLRVRFKRYGAATRAFVERAVAARWSSGDEPKPSSPPPPASSPPPPPASASPPAEHARPSTMPNWEEDQTMRFQRSAMAPGLARASSVPPPPDRDALLERLRRRARETGA